MDADQIRELIKASLKIAREGNNKSKHGNTGPNSGMVEGPVAAALLHAALNNEDIRTVLLENAKEK